LILAESEIVVSESGPRGVSFVTMKERHELKGDEQEVATRPTANAASYEPPAIEELGTLLQITAGTGARAVRDASGASV
jgi:hypothetical protein